MNKISTNRPETFIEAVQMLSSFYCYLHLSGEPTSIGRLDQLLEPFLPGTPTGEAQEIIDCLFVKLCEHVHLNTRLLNDLSAWGMTALPYASTGMFQNGHTIKQWVQCKSWKLVSSITTQYGWESIPSLAYPSLK